MTDEKTDQEEDKDKDAGKPETGAKEAFEAPPPPVDFRLWAEGFVGQALFCLGKYPHPQTGETQKDLRWARYFIDVLGMLQEKTRGNLTDEERRFLEGMVSTLRLTYVEELKSEKKQEAGG